MSAVPERRSDPPSQGISLQELSEVFARVLGGQADPQPASQASKTDGSAADQTAPAKPGEVDLAAAVGTDGVPPAAVPSVLDPGQDAEDDPCPVSPRSILESLLFVGNREGEPLSVRQAAELMRGVGPDDIPALVDELNRRYQSDGCPYEIVSEGTGYRMALREAFFPIRNKLRGRVREARLSQAAVDVLAIVAYRQPLTADDVGRLRGKPSGHVLAQLVRRELLRIERSDQKPRKTLYHTTHRFLALFGLESLGDLPQSDELDRR